MVWPGQFLSVPQGTDWQHKVIGQVFLSQSNRFLLYEFRECSGFCHFATTGCGPTHPAPAPGPPATPQGWVVGPKVIGKIFVSRSNRIANMNSENGLGLAILQPQAVGPPPNPKPTHTPPPPSNPQGWLDPKVIGKTKLVPK